MIRSALLFCLLLTSCCDDASIPRNHKKLYSKQAKERNLAALELARCGEKAGDSVPRLAILIYDKNVGVQSSAAYALRKIDTLRARKVLADAKARKEARRRN